jgi:hypothetical protein
MDSPSYFNVFMVEEFETGAGETARNWTKVGVAFPHAEGPGFNLEIKAFPRDGKLVALPPNAAERTAGERRDGSAEPRNGASALARSTRSSSPRERPR